MNFAMVFPGQGSQFSGMAKPFDAHPQVGEALAEASDAVSVDLTGMAMGDESAGDLNQTENTQPAMLAMDVGVFRAFSAETGGAAPAVMAGHSLGEYAALVCAGAMDFCDAVRAARFRGQAMARATPPGTGAISAVIGMPPEEVDDACEKLRQNGGQIWPANYNSPMQVVIAGEAAAMARAAEALKARGAKKIAPLPMSAPSHCPLMAPAADELAGFLREINFNNPEIPVLHNRTADECDFAADIPQLLLEQVTSPVRWIETVRALAARADPVLECGPGKTLTGLGKRIAPESGHFALSDSESVIKLAGALR